MANNNEDIFISGLTARKYLKCSKAKFEKLVEQGIIQAHRDEEMRWRVFKKSVLDYIHMSPSASGTCLITNEEHYKEVILRLCEAKSSVRMMTGDFNLFRLKPTDNQGKRNKDGTPCITDLMNKAKEGVQVQIILSEPSTNVDEELKEFFRQTNSYPFTTRHCIRNHAKVVIIDDKIAYIGSANATRAGLGQFEPGNFEAGILTDDQKLISSAKALFSKIWDGHYCDSCHRYKKCIEY